MTPLETLAGLLEKYGHAALALRVRSLAAREELRVEGFWEDLGAPDLWARSDSLAALELSPDDSTAQPTDEQQRDVASFRRALFQLADDMALRGVGTPESDWWAEKLRPQRPGAS